VTLGIGDDAAVLEPKPGKRLLATCDAQIEGVHFEWSLIGPYQLGRRAAAVNLSDIASMGGSPVAAFVSLALPPDLPLESFDRLFEGIRDAMASEGASVAGGNLARSDKLVVDIFLLGEADRVLTRSGAKPGDVICVTGPLGGSAAGLDALRHARAHPDAAAAGDTTGAAVDGRLAGIAGAYLDPRPHLREGRAIASSAFATSMIDVSDGLAADLGHLCDASGVGAEIDAAAVPIPEGIEEVSRRTGRAPLDYALFGGEDYALLFTARAAAGDVEAWARGSTDGVRVIGRITSEPGMRLVRPDGGTVPLRPGGWDHFRKAEGG
jgi:thiamine-monophosphate kinase